MSSYDYILIVSVLAMLLVLYLGVELYNHCSKKMPLLATLALFGIILWSRYYGMELAKKAEEPKQIIYQTDNAGAEMFGKITDKEIIEGRYTVEAGAYGNFLVTKEQYESLHIGDEIPDYLKQRGMDSNG